MSSSNDFMLADLHAKYVARAGSVTFTRLYDDAEFGHMFAVLHEALNLHFEAINGRAMSTRHYWAQNSRDLITLFEELRDDLYVLKRIGLNVVLDPAYEEAIERCKPWLSPSGGSSVPEDFELVTVIKYEPVFNRPDATIKLQKQSLQIPLTLVGEGSYAHVYSYVDPDYGITFAVKRARRDISDRDLERFKQEFSIMKRLSFPYIVQVYLYDESRNEYRMEYCEQTLRKFISSRNSALGFPSRKRIALQFLYGMNYLHGQNLLHRDVSLQNVLVKVFESGAVLVKLSDFGLAKEAESTFTRTQTELRGTIIDPSLVSLKDYGVAHEMYSIGWILSYIFTGKEVLALDASAVGRLIQKCVDHDRLSRYQSVMDLVADVEKLQTVPAELST